MLTPFPTNSPHSYQTSLGLEKGGPQASVTIVDDEPWALDVLFRAAEQWKYDCQKASTAEEALLLLERRQTNIVVTDIRMPGRGGVWLVREVHRRWPEIGIIVITAGHDQEAVHECLNGGAMHYFLKPINLDEFHHALETTSRAVLEQRKNYKYRTELERTIQRKTRQLRKTFLSAIDSLVRTLEARDPYTSGHSLRVRDYAVALARTVGLDSKQLKRLALAAKLHDIGKVGLPESILNKAGPLTDDEFDQVRQHPAIGERILSPIIRNREVLAGIRGHHERWNGEGYPDQVSGENIPLVARIISVADCYDALTSSRAYREAMTPERSLEIIRKGSGSQFDPTFAMAFVAMMES
ncbi:MAG: HD domain-containing phosphohydrolase [Gemmataceae bacterium]